MNKIIFLTALVMLCPQKLFALDTYFFTLPKMQGTITSVKDHGITRPESLDCSRNSSISPNNGKFIDVVPSGKDPEIQGMKMRFLECHYIDRQIYKAIGWIDENGEMLGFEIKGEASSSNKESSLGNANKQNAITEAKVQVQCENCNAQNSESIEQFAQETIAAVKKASTSKSKKPHKVIALKPTNKFLNPFSKECANNFISEDGVVGETGKYWIEKIKELNLTQYPLFSVDDEKNFCPRYQYLNEDEKEKAYLYALTVLANKESSCDPGAISPIYVKDKNGNWKKLNPNGRAIGLYQMDSRRSVLNTRDSACRKPMLWYKKQKADGSVFVKGKSVTKHQKENEILVTTNKTEATHNNINCAATILSNLLEHGNGLFGIDDNYWGPLKGKIPIMLNDLKTYKPCFEEQ